MTRRVRSTRVQDISAGVLSPVAPSDRDPDAIVYNCWPPVLPVSIRMRGPRGSCVVVSAASLSVAAPPGEVGSVVGVLFSYQGVASAFTSESFSDPGTDLEDELCHFSPLQETLSPLPESGEELADVTVSISGTGAARHVHSGFRDVGVPNTTPGCELPTDDRCLPDVYYVAGSILL